MITRQTKRLTLREILETDLENIHLLNSLPEVDQYNTLGIPANIGVTKKHFDNWIANMQEPGRSVFVFSILTEKDEFTGMCGITMGKPKYRNAEIWYKFLPEHWNKGYASECVTDILDFCFTVLHLHRVEAGCATENIASIRVLEKCGFVRESHARKLLPIRGKWFDNFGYAILENEYFNQIKK